MESKKKGSRRETKSPLEVLKAKLDQVKINNINHEILSSK